MPRLLITLMLLFWFTVSVSATPLHPPKPLVDFSLTDSQNKPFTKASLKGQFSLLFFGYTTCPGICPQTLAMLKNVVENDPLQDKLQVLFISLNPHHDTPQTLNTFLSHFNAHFRGLTGPQRTIDALSKACHIYYWKDPQTQPTFIDHSGTLILINPNAEIAAVFSPPHDATKLRAELKQWIR